jgi:hypothetical protein
MATVDQLIIEIKAETAQLRKQLGQVNKTLGTTEKRSSRVGTALKAAFAGVGIAAISRAGSSVLDTTRKFEDLRATLQANTGSLKETEDAFDMILKFTAGTTFQVDQVTKAFIEFRRIGIKPTEADLRGIGNVAAAQGVSIDEIAQAIFRGGTTSIEQLQSLGFTAKTSGDKMQISFKDTTREIDKSVESVMKFVREVGETEFADGIEQRANTLTGALSNLGDATDAFQAAIGEAGFKQSTIALVRSLTAMTNESNGAAVAIGKELGGAIKTTHGLIIIFNEALNGLVNLLSKPEEETFFSMSVDFITDLIDKLPTAANFIKQTLRIAKELAELEIFNRELDAFANFEGGDDVVRKEGESIADAIIRTLQEADVDSVSESVKGLSVTFTDELKQAVISTSSAFTKDFVDSLLEGESALDSFKNFAKNIVSQIISIFLQMAVVNEILNRVFNLQGDAKLDTLFSSGSDASVPSEAGGGTIQRGTPTLVGERGAEIFVPNTGGTIMNNMNSKNAMGGSPIIVNQSVNFATGVVPTVRAEVTKMLPQISDVTKGAVLEAAVRGGSFRKGLMGRG